MFWVIHNRQCRKCHTEELLPFGVVVWQENQYKKMYTGINNYYPDTPRERGVAWWDSAHAIDQLKCPHSHMIKKYFK